MLTKILSYFAGPFGWIKANAKLVIIISMVALVSGAYLKGCSDGKEIVKNDIRKAALKAEKKARAADNVSANQQVKDELSVAETRKEYHDAIENAKNGAPSAPARALACERLRNSKERADLPAACRY